jgi:hypothetical protein
MKGLKMKLHSKVMKRIKNEKVHIEV